MATTYFNVNQTTLTGEAKRDLDDLVQKALPLKGYLIEVAGYGDTRQLSEQRAEALVQYSQ
jgi:outer membrane protein OmpA-like peptidoglycan-associated protein